MVEGHGVHRVAASARRHLVGKRFTATSPNGRFAHGAEVIDPVWRLLEVAYQAFGVLPTLLERDFNFPPFDTLCDELRHIGAPRSHSSHREAARPSARTNDGRFTLTHAPWLQLRRAVGRLFRSAIWPCTSRPARERHAFWRL